MGENRKVALFAIGHTEKVIHFVSIHALLGNMTSSHEIYLNYLIDIR